MEILGVGLPELAFIVIIALIVLGPKDMVAAGRTMGKTLRKVVTSPTWKAMQATGQELQRLPTKLIREAGLEELKDLEKEVQDATRVSIDPRAISHSFDEKQARDASSSMPEEGAAPRPLPPLSEQDPEAESSPKDSQA